MSLCLISQIPSNQRTYLKNIAQKHGEAYLRKGKDLSMVNIPTLIKLMLLIMANFASFVLDWEGVSDSKILNG